MYCYRCGYRLEGKHTFCPNCGTKLNVANTNNQQYRQPPMQNTPVQPPINQNTPVQPPVNQNIPVQPPVNQYVPVQPPVNQYIPVQSPVVQNAPISPVFNNGNKKKKKKKGLKIAIAVIACVCVIAILITSILPLFKKKSYVINTNSYDAGDNYIELNEGVTYIDDMNAEKGLKNLSYDESNLQYTLTYKSLPDSLRNLSSGDVFVVSPNESAKEISFQMGFSGRVISSDDESITFAVPTFDEVFNKFKLDNNSVSASGVKFIPEKGVSVEGLTSIPLGINAGISDKIEFGNFSAETTYKETDEISKLEGYNLLAEELSLKIDNKFEVDGNTDLKVSGKVSLKYPAVKFIMDYDGENDNINSYDVGLITNQSVNVKIKGETNLNLPQPGIDFSDFGILDLKDTSDMEPGKIVLGTLFVGYYVPLINTRNQTPIIGIGVAFQICMAANGKLEIECETSESGLLRIEADSDGNNICELKSPSCPNPVLGEQYNEEKSYDDISMKSSYTGTLEVTAAIGVDVGFSVLGTIPLKIATDVLGFKLVSEFSNEEKVNVVENLNAKEIQHVDYYQFKTSSTLRFMIGADFGIKGARVKVGKIGYEDVLWKKVWFQYPQPVEFSIDECDFGGIQLGDFYSNNDLNSAFYKNMEEHGVSASAAKLKDTAIQQALRKIADMLNVSISDIIETDVLDGSNGEYEITCFSNGAIYFLEGGTVKAEMIVGDDVYNRSNISHSSSGEMFKQVYSEPSEEKSIEVDIGSIGEDILKALEMDALMGINGLDLTYYHYTADDNSNMDVFLKGNDVMFIIAYCDDF